MPNILWVYSDSPGEKVQVGQLQRDNHHYFANASGYEVRYLTDDNYRQFLDAEAVSHC